DRSAGPCPPLDRRERRPVGRAAVGRRLREPDPERPLPASPRAEPAHQAADRRFGIARTEIREPRPARSRFPSGAALAALAPVPARNATSLRNRTGAR